MLQGASCRLGVPPVGWPAGRPHLCCVVRRQPDGHGLLGGMGGWPGPGGGGWLVGPGRGGRRWGEAPTACRGTAQHSRQVALKPSLLTLQYQQAPPKKNQTQPTHGRTKPNRGWEQATGQGGGGRVGGLTFSPRKSNRVKPETRLPQWLP